MLFTVAVEYVDLSASLRQRRADQWSCRAVRAFGQCYPARPTTAGSAAAPVRARLL